MLASFLFAKEKAKQSGFLTRLSAAFGKKIAILSLIAIYLTNLNLVPAGLSAMANPVAIGQNNKPALPTKLYLTRAGDNLAALAKRYHISLKALIALNNLFNNNLFNKQPNFNANAPLKKGTSLIVPKIPLSPTQARALEQDLARSNQASNGIARELALALANNKNIDSLRQELKMRGLRAGLNAATSSLSAWLNHYATAQFRLNLIDGFNLADSGFDLLIPIYDQNKLLVFNQTSLAATNNGAQLNIGFGNRYFLNDYMIGANGFLDYNISSGHARLGLGAEYWRDYLRVALNSYFALSGWKGSKLVKAIDNDRHHDEYYLERPANGFDLRAVAYLPFYPQIGIHSILEQYFGSNVGLFDNKSLRANPFGLTLGLSYSPIPLVNFDLAYKHHNGRHSASLGAKLTYHIGVPFNAQIDSQNLPWLQRLGGARYSFVERNNNIVLNYKKDEPLILANIDGIQGESYPLVIKADLGKNWQIKAIENPGNITLSSECFDKNNLSACKVTLPPFNPEGSNNYQLSYHLIHNKTGREKSFHSSILVDSDKSNDDLALLFKPEDELITAPQGKLSLFDRTEIGKNWSILKWQYKTDGKEQSDWQTTTSLISKACLEKDNLAKCQFIAPSEKQAGVTAYHLRLLLLNKKTSEYKNLETKITIDPSELLLFVNSPISDIEGSQHAIFAKIANTRSWQEPHWILPSGFTERGGKLSGECNSLATLKDCTVTLPQYSLLGPDNSNENSFRLALAVRNDHNRLHKEFCDINVKAKYAKAELAIDIAKRELNYGEKLPISISLSEGGQPIELSEQDLRRYFQFKIESNSKDKPQANGTSSSVLGKITKMGPGSYALLLTAGTLDERIKLTIFYGDSFKRQFIINVKPVIDEKHSRFSALPQQTVREGTIELRFMAKDKEDQALNHLLLADLGRLTLKIRKKHQNEREDSVDYMVSDFEEQGKGVYKAYFSSSSIGEYEITPIVKESGAKEGREFKSLSTKITVIAPSFDIKQSSLAIDKTSLIATGDDTDNHNSAHLSFSAKNAQGQPLSGLAKDIKIAVYQDDEQLEELALVEDKGADKLGLYHAEFPLKKANGQYHSGSYHFYVLYMGGFDKSLSTQLLAMAALKAKVTKAPHKLNYNEKSEIDFELLANNQPLDLSPEQIKEHLQMTLSESDSLTKSASELAASIKPLANASAKGAVFVSDIEKIAAGKYRLAIHSGDFDQHLLLELRYSNKAIKPAYNISLLSLPLLVEAQIDKDRSELIINQEKAILGKDKVVFEFLAKNSTGEILENLLKANDSRIKFVLTPKDTKGELMEQEQFYVPAVDVGAGHYRGFYSAAKAVCYKLSVIAALKADAALSEAAKQSYNICFSPAAIDSEHSSFSSDKSILRPVGHIDRNFVANLTFTARDKQGAPIKGLEDTAYIAAQSPNGTIEHLALAAQGNGIYSARFGLTAKGGAARAQGEHQLFIENAGQRLDKLKLKITIDYSNLTIHPDAAELQLSSDILLLERDHGKAIDISYRAKARTNIEVNPDNLRLILRDLSGQEVKDSARFFNKQHKGHSVTCQMQALKEGEYLLTLQYLNDSAGYQDIFTKHVYFIEAKPSDNSKLSADPYAIAFNKSAGRPDAITMVFEAYDKYGHKINYDQLSDDKGLVERIASRIKHISSDKEWDVPFTYQGGNRFSWHLSAEEIYQASEQGPEWTGGFLVYALYEGKRTHSQFWFLLSPEATIPNEVHITPAKAKMMLGEQASQNITYEYRFNGLSYNMKRAINIHYKVLAADNSEVKDILTIKNEGTKQILTISPHERGVYRIVPYFRDYADPNISHEIKNGQAQLIAYKDLCDLAQKAQLTLNPPILRSLGNREGNEAASTELCFVAKDGENNPLSQLRNLEAKLLYQNSTESYALKEKPQQAGLYCTRIKLVKDGLLRQSGNYKILLEHEYQPWPNLSATLKIDTSKDDIEQKDVTLELSRPYAMLKSLSGTPISISYKAYNKAHQEIDKRFLRLALQNIAGSDASKAGEFSARTEVNGRQQRYLTALEKGEYQIALIYNDPYGNSRVIASKKIYFIDDRPSKLSKLYFTPDVVALDDSAGFPTKTQLIFEAYDAYGHKLDYDVLSSDKDLPKRITAKLLGIYRQEVGCVPPSFGYDGANRFSWSTSGAEIAGPPMELYVTGINYVRVYYNGEDLGLEAVLDISAHKMVPDATIVTPQRQVVHIGKIKESMTEYRFSRYGFVLYYPDAPIIFKVFKDGKLTDIKPKVIWPEEPWVNRVYLPVTEPGVYRIKGYYKTFHNPPQLLAIPNAEGIVEVKK